MSKLSLRATACVLGVFTCGSAFGEVVYDSLNGFLGHYWVAGSGAWVGDEIGLVGIGRTVTRFEFNVGDANIGSLSGEDVTVGFFTLGGGQPTTMFWSGNVVVAPGTKVAAIDVPNVIVPGVFVFALRNNRGPGTQLQTWATNVNLGGSPDYYWRRDSDTAAWSTDRYGEIGLANLGARVTAVPEPSTAVVVAGLLAMSRLRRRERGVSESFG